MKIIRNFLITAFVLVIIITLGVSLFGSQSNNTTVHSPTTTTQKPTTTTPTKSTIPVTLPATTIPATTTPSYTLTQVATHANASSCWSIVQGNVYDLTSWINQHPGGSGAILSMCGKDGTAAFDGQHGGQRRPENELASFIIGTYKN